MLLKRLLKNRIFLIGLIILAVGSGPLLGILLAAWLGLISDTSPNPVYFGMLAYFTFWPGIIIMMIGLFNLKQQKARNDD